MAGRRPENTETFQESEVILSNFNYRSEAIKGPEVSTAVVKLPVSNKNQLWINLQTSCLGLCATMQHNDAADIIQLLLNWRS